MIRAKRLAHLVFSVTDLQASRDFYMKVLGLKVAAEDAAAGVCFLSLGDQHHDLALVQRASKNMPPPDETQPRLIHFAWQLRDFAEVQAKYRELTAQGVAVDTIQHNVTNSLYVKDPDGHVCELYCDRWEDGFAAMKTRGPMTKVLDIETGEAVGEELYAVKAKERATTD